ncbi:MAG TPA: EamA family transporter [Phycisphaerales bacterium]|nr:EamA family transporter [Phycisphaerales bacterium]
MTRAGGNESCREAGLSAGAGLSYCMSRARIVTVWWLACVLWSAGWLFIKIGLSDLPPVTFVALRLTLAFIVLSPIVTWRDEWKLLRISDLPVIAVSGLLLLGVNFTLTFWGAQYLPSALASVLQATSPVFGFLIGISTGAERFSLARGLALPIGVAGVALVSSGQFAAGPLAGWGSAAVVGGAACAALAYAMVKRRAAHLPSPLMVAMQTLCAMIPMLLAAVIIDGYPLQHNWTAKAIGALLYLAIASSVVAFWLNYWLLKRVSATTVLSMALVQPLIAAVLGAVVLGERFGAAAAAGGAMILLSAAVILKRE